MQEVLPANRFIRIRYEDLCTWPEGELQKISSFLGLEYEPQMLRFREVVHHNVSGNAVRFRSEGIQKPDESCWRRQMNPEALKIFYKTAGWLNRWFRYS